MKGYVTLFGYILFVLGFLSILLGLLGIELRILSWIDNFASPIPLLIRLIMLFGGIIIMYVSKTNSLDYEQDAS